MNQIIDVAITELTEDEPVSLVDAKRQVVVTHTDDDELIESLITVARKQIEDLINLSLIYKRIVLIADWEMEYPLPFGPVIGIEAVASPSGPCGSGPVQYETATDWKLDMNTFNPAACRRYRIQYTVGYSVVPAPLKRAILAQVAYLYEHRGDEVLEPCTLSKQLASPYIQLAWTV